jgi:hypothetical protein
VVALEKVVEVCLVETLEVFLAQTAAQNPLDVCP